MSGRSESGAALKSPPIETASLLLRALTPGDAPKLFRMSQEEGMRVWLPSQVYRDMDETVSILDFLIARFKSPGDPRQEPYVFGVTLKSTSELIGHAGFSPLDQDVEVGFAIEKAHQGKGFATEAVRAACEWVTESFSLATVMGVTAMRNAASQGVLLRSGFVRQRVERMRFQGTEQSVIFYSFSGSKPAAGDS